MSQGVSAYLGGRANDFSYFFSRYHVDSSTVHVHASAQCIHIFLGLCTFAGLGLGLLPGEFGFIQPFRGILMHSGLSVGFLESFAASARRFGFRAFLAHPHTVLHKVVPGKFGFVQPF